MEAPGERLIAKMWESLVDKGIGGILAPYQEKRLGKARAETKREEMLIVARAEKEIEQLKASANYSSTIGSINCLPEKIEPTLDSIELAHVARAIELSDASRREVNVAKAIMIAEDTLALDKESPSELLVDEDWLHAWRENAGRVSAEELQSLWGKILAGEVKQSGSYSLRTLEFVRGLSKNEAELLEKVSKFVVDNLIYKKFDKHLDSHGILFGDLILLEELGLLIGVAGGSLHNDLEFECGIEVKNFESLGSKAICVISQKDNFKISMPVIKVTNLGYEVLKIGNFEVDEDYFIDLAKEFSKRGCKVTLANKERTPEGYTLYRDYLTVENPNKPR